MLKKEAAPFETASFVEVGGGLFHDPQWRGLCNKIPVRFKRSPGFFVPIPPPRKRASV